MKTCEQKAQPRWDWNCSATLVSASQTDEQSSMGILLAEAQKMSHTCFVLLAHVLMQLLLLYCNSITCTNLSNHFTFSFILNILHLMPPFPLILSFYECLKHLFSYPSVFLLRVIHIIICIYNLYL